MFEVAKWVYGLLVAGMVFLFFCLVLDCFCFWVGSGWNPLLGQWPIFSGTLAALLYNDFITVFCLLLGLGAIARLVIWDRVPGILGLLVKHPD